MNGENPLSFFMWVVGGGLAGYGISSSLGVLLLGGTLGIGVVIALIGLFVALIALKVSSQ